jgi:hypothetical protein
MIMSVDPQSVDELKKRERADSRGQKRRLKGKAYSENRAK